MFGLRVLQFGVQNLERACERDANTPCNRCELGFRLVTKRKAQWGASAQVVQNRRKFEFLIELAELIDLRLQSLRNGQIDGLDLVAAVCPRNCLAANEEIVELVINEVAEALEVLLSMSRAAVRRKKRSNLEMLMTCMCSPLSAYKGSGGRYRLKDCAGNRWALQEGQASAI